jgi:pimeloyl-ACP methyl ester carboxylesterase
MKLEAAGDFQAEIEITERRVLDWLLQQPGIDPKRIACVGHSYGGIAGGVLAGVEPRIAAFVLSGALASEVRHIKENGRSYWQEMRRNMSPEEFSKTLEMLRETDPGRYLQKARAPVQVQCARLDTGDSVRGCPRGWRNICAWSHLAPRGIPQALVFSAAYSRQPHDGRLVEPRFIPDNEPADGKAAAFVRDDEARFAGSIGYLEDTSDCDGFLRPQPDAQRDIRCMRRRIVAPAAIVRQVHGHILFALPYPARSAGHAEGHHVRDAAVRGLPGGVLDRYAPVVETAWIADPEYGARPE